MDCQTDYNKSERVCSISLMLMTLTYMHIISESVSTVCAFILDIVRVSIGQQEISQMSGLFLSGERHKSQKQPSKRERERSSIFKSMSYAFALRQLYASQKISTSMRMCRFFRQFHLTDEFIPLELNLRSEKTEMSTKCF